jgi:hypothetical protein
VGPPLGHPCSLWCFRFYGGWTQKMSVTLACVCWLPDNHVNIMSSSVLTYGTTLLSNSFNKCKYVQRWLSQSCLMYSLVDEVYESKNLNAFSSTES